LLIAPALLLTLLFESGCATKKYVKQQVDPLSGRVDELSEVSKGNENAIKDVDSRAQAGIQTVQAKTNEVDQKAIAATQKAQEGQQLAQNNQTKIVSVENNFNQKLSNLDSYKSVDTSSINFTLNSAELNDEAKATFQEALQHKASGAIIHSSLATIAWLQGDKENAVWKKCRL
jgi:hypothetical protein